MDEVNRRNTTALEQANKDLTEKLLAQQIRIDGLVAAVGSVLERVRELEVTVGMLRALTTGRGPTA